MEETKNQKRTFRVGPDCSPKPKVNTDHRDSVPFLTYDTIKIPDQNPSTSYLKEIIITRVGGRGEDSSTQEHITQMSRSLMDYANGQVKDKK